MRCIFTIKIYAKRPQDADHRIQKVILGTHTSNNEQNYLLIAKVQLPLSEEKDKEVVDSPTKKSHKIQIEYEIPHQGEVNRARYMPQQSNVIATKTVSGEIHIFDYFKHPLKPETHLQVKPELKLLGHEKEGYGLAWSLKRKGYLLSGSDDHKVCIWDIEQATQLNLTMEPILKYEAHTGVVQDVAWHKHYEYLFGSVGDDFNVKLWDIRSDKKEPAQVVIGHTSDILSMDFNPLNEHLLATSSADKSVAIWDLRNLKMKQCSLEKHKDEVINVAWSPHRETVLASAAQDRKVNIWDLSKAGKELRFVHAGHTSRINEISWNYFEDLLLASAAEDNILQVWQVAKEIFN